MKQLKNFSINLADNIASFLGSWNFIIIQSSILLIWIFINVDKIVNFDPYPFILLNLFLSFEAAYATPLILMSANRQAERDREHMLKDLKIDEEDHIIIAELKIILDKLRKDIVLDHQLLKQHDVAKEERAELKAILQEVRALLNDKL